MRAPRYRETQENGTKDWMGRGVRAYVTICYNDKKSIEHIIGCEGSTSTKRGRERQLEVQKGVDSSVQNKDM